MQMKFSGITSWYLGQSDLKLVFMVLYGMGHDLKLRLYFVVGL